MPIRRLFEESVACTGAPGVRSLVVSRQSWRQAAGDMAAAGGRLVALWANGGENDERNVRAALIADAGMLVLQLPVVATDADYPGLEDLFSAAGRMQRAAADLTGVRSTDPDVRPWLRHAAWPASFRPLVDPMNLTDNAGSVEAYEIGRASCRERV